MPFVNADELPRLELFPKALSGIIHGDNLMLSFLDLAPGCEIPEHSHPHEQAGLVLSGSLRFRIGEEERVAGPGDAFIIPGDVVHWGIVEGDEVVKVLDIFSPPRDDYIDRYNRHVSTSADTRWT
ncbi:MAG: cupin domain-containing protein [Candidatus Latescibacteria bacterium]|jgi:quercetin dioxygenase-like cupin family protein|nr:cupin [Gemmatimonadaceae bacterium]MDP7449115.1 cupin domain-containing protein [Candidatus Latescibacterota bacterium]HJP28970.1 cupin domain-containing protein [Candidatus Latescibacterota bacterium]|tara:strand:- start:194 stop:568 length:375 start_codon:yes stop_codon:yes gene_type:complete